MGRPREHDDQTRRQLRAAAERLVAEGGPDALSVRAVADAAGTTTRAVYSLFGSKEGLVAALAQTAFELLYHDIDQLPETDDPVADLVAVGTQAVRGLVRDHPALYRIAFQRIAGLQPATQLVEARERAWVQLQGRVQRMKDAEPPRSKIGPGRSARALTRCGKDSPTQSFVAMYCGSSPKAKKNVPGVTRVTTVLRGFSAPPLLEATNSLTSRAHSRGSRSD